MSVISSGDGQCIWTTELSCDVYGKTFGTEVFRYNEENYLMFRVGAQVLLFTSDGSEVFSSGTPGTICGGALGSDAQYIFCTENGEIFCFQINEGTVSDTTTNIKMVLHTDRFIYHPETQTAWLIDRTSGKIVVMHPEEDNHCEIIDTKGRIDEIAQAQTGLAVFCDEEDGSSTVSIYKRKAEVNAKGQGDNKNSTGIRKTDFDLNNPDLQWTVKAYVGGLFCCQERIFMYGEEEDDIIVLTGRSADTGEILWQSEMSLKEGTTWSDMQIAEERNLLLYNINDDGFAVLDLETGRQVYSSTIDVIVRDNGMDNSSYYFLQELCISTDGRYICALVNENIVGDSSLHFLNLENQSWIDLPEEIKEIPLYYEFFVDGRTMYISGNKYLVVYSDIESNMILIDLRDISIHLRIPFVASSRRSACTIEDENFLLLWGDRGTIEVFDTQTGEILYKTEEIYDNVDYFTYDASEGLLTVVEQDADRSLYYMTDEGQMVLLRNADRIQCYFGLLAAIDSEKEQLRIYPIRSLSEMISEAKEYVASRTF